MSKTFLYDVAFRQEICWVTLGLVIIFPVALGEGELAGFATGMINDSEASACPEHFVLSCLLSPPSLFLW